jgi:signal transduction histidine kinase
MHVFQNLIQNAIKYTPSERTPKVIIKVAEEENNWLFAVEDNGNGISKEDINKLFVLYRRINKDNKGIGFGLAVCKKIIDGHSGRIWVTSKVNEGSTFHFKLPKEGEKQKEFMNLVLDILNAKS